MKVITEKDAREHLGAKLMKPFVVLIGDRLIRNLGSKGYNRTGESRSKTGFVSGLAHGPPAKEHDVNHIFQETVAGHCLGPPELTES